MDTMLGVARAQAPAHIEARHDVTSIIDGRFGPAPFAAIDPRPFVDHSWSLVE